MITDKNQHFLTKFGSPEVTKKIWNESDSFDKNSSGIDLLTNNPHTHSDVIDEIVNNHDMEYISHPNVSREVFDKHVKENSGYGRQYILKSPNINADHLKTLEKKKPFGSSDIYALARNPHLKEDELDIATNPKYKLSFDDFDHNNFAKNKNLQPRHISNLIKISKYASHTASPSLMYDRLAEHPNLSKENAEELRAVNHPYINELLDKRGM